MPTPDSVIKTAAGDNHSGSFSPSEGVGPHDCFTPFVPLSPGGALSALKGRVSMGTVLPTNRCRAGTGIFSKAKGQAMSKNTICLWYDKDAEAAATFPDSAVGAVHHAPSDYPSGAMRKFR
jgi:hypothetical protein